MKKILIAVIFVMAVAAALFFTNFNGGGKGEKEFLEVGVLGYAGTTEEKFQEGFENFRKFVLSSDNAAKFPDDDFINSLKSTERKFYFYDSLMSLMMSLKAGKLDEMILPESVANYLLSKNEFYRNVRSTSILKSELCFGFREEDTALKEDFDRVINEMKNDGTLQKFTDIYITSEEKKDPDPIRPVKIKDAELIKIVVTGDMPPIDMFAGDGKPTGYNTAILSEIGKRLNKNIDFISTDSNGRSSALFSKRADVVFWYRAVKSTAAGNSFIEEIFKDVPEGVILSEPYYSWTVETVIRMNNQQGLLGLFSK